MARIGSLTADLNLESAAFIRDLSRASQAVASNTAQMRRHMRAVESAATGIQRQFGQMRAGIAAFAGALAVRQFATFVQQSLAFSGALSETAASIGLTVEELQQYRFAAQQSGIAVGDLDKSLAFFSKTLGQARAGTGPLSQALKKTDSDFLKQITTSKSAGDALELYLERLAETPGSADRGRLAVAAFGRNAVRMTLLVKDGTRGLEELKQRAVDLGLVLSGPMAAAADAIADRISVFQDAMRVGFAKGVIVEMAQAFQTTEGNIKSASEIAMQFGRVVGRSMLAVAEGAQWVARHMREIVVAGSGLVALRLGAMLGGAASAALAFAKALKAAAASGALFSLLTSGKGLKGIIGMAAAVAAMAAAWQQFGSVADDAIAQVERLFAGGAQGLRDFGESGDAAAASFQKYHQNLETSILQHRMVADAAGKGEAALQKVKDQIAATNAVTEAGVEINSRYGRTLYAAALAEEEWKRKAQEAEEALRERLQSLENYGKSVASSLDSAFSEFLDNGKINFTDFVNSALKDLQRLIFQQNVTKPFGDLISNLLKAAVGSMSAGGGATPAPAFSGPINSGSLPFGPANSVFHGGGIVGRDRVPTIRLPAGIFDNAPRFHRGLMPGEFPSVLKAGEGVFTPAQMKALGGSGKVNVTVQNINNVSGVSVTTREVPDGRGGRRIINEINESMATAAGMPGSPFDKAMRRRGAGQALMRR